MRYTKRKKLKVDRDKIKMKFGGHCAYCGVELKEKFNIDHCIAFERGGSDEESNLFPSCFRCNNQKFTFNIEEFRREIEKSTERLVKYQSGYRLAKDFGLINETGIKVKFWFEVFNERTRKRDTKAKSKRGIIPIRLYEQRFSHW